jgi:hypothetical protein
VLGLVTSYSLQNYSILLIIHVKMREMGLDDFAFSHIFGVPNGDLEVT